MQQYQNWHPNFPVNLDNCKDEPIHIPGAIQEFGVLIAFDPSTLEVKAISENAKKFLPVLNDFEKSPIKIDSLLTITESANSSSQTKLSEKRRLVFVNVLNSKDSKNFFGVSYLSGNLQVLEIEIVRKEKTDRTSYLADLPSMMKDIQDQESLKELVDFSAEKIKDLTGFDRVMVYQYDEDWNGKVVAEAKENHLEPFLGLHYPASDIPPQARALYEKNWIRIIPTVNYKPSILEPKHHQNIDLSNSVLRSVSPIHIKYLKNMGVGASMSISLMIEGKLWGLIACHHYSDHLVPLDIRLGCEAYGQLISWHIQTLKTATALNTMKSGEQTLHNILEQFSDISHLKEAAINNEQNLLNIFDCTGMVIRLGDEVVELGKAPDDIFSSAVAKALINRNILEPLTTKDAQRIPELAFLTPNSDYSGLMALSLAPKHNYYIICTRPEEIQTVDWAGMPNKISDTNFDDPSERLIPRGSFALWKETHKGQSQNWSNEVIDLFKKFGLLFVKIVIERKELLEKSNDELKALSQAKDEFVAMVSHELRTPLNAIIGWTDLALSGDLEPAQLPESLKIIQRNARSQNQLINDLLDVSRIISGKMKISVRSMRVSDVVDAVVLSFGPAADAKLIKIICHLDEDADSIIGDSDRIQQVVWNLLSNAVKFSPKNSKIWVSIKRIDSHIKMQVRDQGIGIEPENLNKIFGRFEQVDSSISRKAGGLGLGLAISKHIVELHGGRIEVESEGENKGTSFNVYFPIAPTLPPEKDQMPIDDSFDNRSDKYQISSKRLYGEVILIVEDEPDAAQFLNLLISANGAKTFVAHNGQEALEIIQANAMEIGIVLSDVGMPIMDGYSLVKSMRQSKDPHINSICAIALTAFGRPQDRIMALRSGFDSYIAKPVMQEELLTVLESACKTKNR